MTPIMRHAIAKVNAGKHPLLMNPFQQLKIHMHPHMHLHMHMHLLKLMLLNIMTFLNIHLTIMLLCMNMKCQPAAPRSLR